MLQTLVLLNVCPDQSMKDEGLAREVINLVQKLRKEAKVTPSDPVTVYFQVVSNPFSFYPVRCIRTSSRLRDGF